MQFVWFTIAKSQKLPGELAVLVVSISSGVSGELPVAVLVVSWRLIKGYRWTNLGTKSIQRRVTQLVMMLVIFISTVLIFFQWVND